MVDKAFWFFFGMGQEKGHLKLSDRLIWPALHLPAILPAFASISRILIKATEGEKWAFR